MLRWMGADIALGNDLRDDLILTMPSILKETTSVIASANSTRPVFLRGPWEAVQSATGYKQSSGLGKGWGTEA